MPRPLRTLVAGGFYHVWARGNRQQPIFLTHEDRMLFLVLLATTANRCRWQLHAYSLMDNHVHLVIETPEPNLSYGMHRLNGAFVRVFNELHGYFGHLF